MTRSKSGIGGNNGCGRREFLRLVAGAGLSVLLPACRGVLPLPSPVPPQQAKVPTERYKKPGPWRVGRAGLGDLSSWLVMLSAHIEYGFKEKYRDSFQEYLATSANWDADKQALDIQMLKHIAEGNW